jgi:hypothetical protein
MDCLWVQLKQTEEGDHWQCKYPLPAWVPWETKKIASWVGPYEGQKCRVFAARPADV